MHFGIELIWKISLKIETSDKACLLINHMTNYFFQDSFIDCSLQSGENNSYLRLFLPQLAVYLL